MRDMTIMFPLPGAERGTDSDPANPLRRALAPLMEKSKLVPVMLPMLTTSSEGGPPERWLGIFVRSAAGRILFFPGLLAPTGTVRGSAGGVELFSRPFLLDHLSLDPSRDAWHLTSPGSGEHQGGPTPLPIGEGRVFWFTMAIQSLSTLRMAQSMTTATFEIENRAQEFKLRQLQQLANDQAPGKLPLPPAPSDGGLHFPFFAVIVGPSSFKPYEGPDWWPPYGSSQVEGPAVDELPGLTMSILQVPFDHETDIQIMACWLPGRVLVPMVQTAPLAE